MTSPILFLSPVLLPLRSPSSTASQTPPRFITTTLKLTNEEASKPKLQPPEKLFTPPDKLPSSPSPPTPPQAKPFWQRLLHDESFDDLRTFTLAFALALLVRSTLVEPRYIPSLSMYPTFEVGDQFLVDKLTPRLQHLHANDIVVFEPPSALQERGYRKSDAFIKRVIAQAGDTVSIKNGILTVNGEKRDESFINEPPVYSWGPAVVPDGMVMVLGDNRNNSYDSHVWGFLPESNIIGKALVRYWPPARFGTTF